MRAQLGVSSLLALEGNRVLLVIEGPLQLTAVLSPPRDPPGLAGTLPSLDAQVAPSVSAC
jgi:hypothetical protein